MTEYVICGASLPHCSGVEPPAQIREQVNAAFIEQLTDGYRVLPRIQFAGTEDETDNAEDGTYREMPTPIRVPEMLVRGAIICDACYCTLCVLSPSGAAATHEIPAAIAKARSMDASDLPRVG